MNKKNRQLTIFGIMVFFFWMSLYSYQPQLSVYCSTVGAGISMTGVILSSYGLAQMFVRLPVGIISDMIKKRKLFVVLGNVLTILAALGFFFAKTPFQLLLFRCLSGAAASAWVAFTVMFSGYYSKDEAPQAMSRLMIFNKCGCLTGMLLGGVLSQSFSVRTSFLLSMAAGISALFLSFRLEEPDMSDVKPLKLSDIPSILKNRSLLLFGLMALLFQTMEQGTTLGFVPKYAAQLGADASQLGILSAASIFGGMLASLASSGWLLKRFSALSVVIAGAAVYTLADILLPIIAGNVPMIVVMQFISGVGNTFGFALLTGLAISEIPDEQRGAAMGIFQSICALGMFAGPLITGFLAERFPMGTSISIVGCVGIVILVTGILISKRKHS